MRKPIFKPEDFASFTGYPGLENLSNVISNMAEIIFNEWIRDNGKIVYSHVPRKFEGFVETWVGDKAWVYQKIVTHQAILVNIEPIEQCKHPPDKCAYKLGQGIKLEKDRSISMQKYEPAHFECECGAKVKPKEFEEIE